MPVIVAVPTETVLGETRVAQVPETVARLCKQGVTVRVQSGAGTAAGYTDAAYSDAGAEIVDGAALYRGADIVVKVQAPAAEEIGQYEKRTVVLGFLYAYRQPGVAALLRDRGISFFAMELVPRITRAQSMDALSSQATVAGYKGALIAADRSVRFFPMLTTAAGTIRPAKVLVLGAGVAGLQAIATARRLGAIVEAYDVRHAAREQVESLGARFLQVELDAETEGGYARELTADEKEREQVMLWQSVKSADAVITTAQIPGRDAPLLVNRRMVQDMKPGSVVVDLAAESGGNCELTEPGREVNIKGVMICGPVNVPAMLPLHASDMYAKNILNFLQLLVPGGEALNLDWEDEILAGSVVTHDGEIRHAATRELLTRELS